MPLKLKKKAGELQNDGAFPAGGTPAERFLTRVKKGIEVWRGDSVRAAPADGFAPGLGMACRARCCRWRLRCALHAAQVAHHGGCEIVGVSSELGSVYEAAEQIGHTQPDQKPRDQYCHPRDPTHELTPF